MKFKEHCKFLTLRCLTPTILDDIQVHYLCIARLTLVSARGGGNQEGNDHVITVHLDTPQCDTVQ